MKQLYFLISFFIIATTQAQNDTIFFYKSGVLVFKTSIKPSDLDSITFKKRICADVWATKDLDVSTYSDGTPIPQVTDPTAWRNLTTGAWCYNNNATVNGVTYGKLYNWYAVAGIYDANSSVNPALRKKLAPTGWHVPTDAEWSTLITCLGGDTVAGGKMKETGTRHWSSPNTNATDSSGFTALPGGYRLVNGAFSGVGFYGYWWSSSEDLTLNGWVRSMSCTNGINNRYSTNKTVGCSVRCRKD